jgi:hypothetical protein
MILNYFWIFEFGITIQYEFDLLQALDLKYVTIRYEIEKMDYA